MSVVSDDRWTCPSCGRSLVAYGSDADVKAAIACVQARHSKAHAEAAAILGRLGFPTPVKQTPPRKQTKGKAA